MLWPTAHALRQARCPWRRSASLRRRSQGRHSSRWASSSFQSCAAQHLPDGRQQGRAFWGRGALAGGTANRRAENSQRLFTPCSDYHRPMPPSRECDPKGRMARARGSLRPGAAFGCARRACGALARVLGCAAQASLGRTPPVGRFPVPPRAWPLAGWGVLALGVGLAAFGGRERASGPREPWPRKVAYFKRPCSQADVDRAAFLHVSPQDPADLPLPRRCQRMS